MIDQSWANSLLTFAFCTRQEWKLVMSSKMSRILKNDNNKSNFHGQCLRLSVRGDGTRAQQEVTRAQQEWDGADETREFSIVKMQACVSPLPFSASLSSKEALTMKKKWVFMICHQSFVRTHLADKACKGRLTGEGLSFRERKRKHVQCQWCIKNFAASCIDIHRAACPP